MTETEPIVVLAQASTPVEREIITRWLREEGLGSEHRGTPTQIDLDVETVAGKLVSRTDDPLVVPVRVLWLPPERDGTRRAHVSDLATLSNPRNPNRLMQRWIVRNAPDRHRVLTGEPALLSELRKRHVAAAGDPGARTFARYIHRTAVVALERSERSVIGDRYKVPRLVAEEILDAPAFRRELDEIAAQTGITSDEAYDRAEAALRELVAVQSRLVTDLFTQAMSPFHKRAWTVHADETGLAELRGYNRRYPLIFLPSHRSYVDPFVLGDVLARNDFPPNHLIGGANLSFWPIGPIARRSGAVFIRRSFGDDEIYKAVVEEYFAYLLTKRFNMEWYFEGGRSRTGKLRPPRYGLLNYVAEAVRSRRVDDALLVPVSITYERLHELGAIASEQLGGKKKPEGLAWMARYVRNQQNSAGQVYVRFGEPLSARDRLQAHGDVFGAEPNEERERRAVQRVAFEVAVGINKITPISANALVTLALLGVSERALTLPELQAVIAPVVKYMDERKIPKGDIDVLGDRTRLMSVLDDLAIAKVVTAYTGGDEPVYSIEPGQHLVAAFYRNSAIHWFVNRALLELAILGAAESGFTDPLRAGWDEAKRLRDLLKFEFFFPEREKFEEEMTEEMLLVDPQWRSRTPSVDEVLEKLTETGFFMAHRALRSFFDAQLVVAERLALRDPSVEVDKNALLDECVAVGKQMLMQARLHSPESVSSELFTTALKLANNRNLMGPGDELLGQRRAEFAEELREVGERISKAELLDASNRRNAPGGYR
ncbi:glycerol-3-phosphate 1-O-acyltransferase [Antrihabitans cavernicola]|uniref:Glycerol-3-phosphate 1-O-acyltransferase n=1 Tax=Antrihabitans cavernicola TaxID=2495913 RepID=A0A5A7S6E2_9NOCA|nr:glycerol-3-phosphate 1-O-acyltransferase [Spelaeibacter cavernicola]KAA0017976.1 glycerol-3-phosphate 1-O-acyltransferase [Spelaeibacter cavernicola]